MRRSRKIFLAIALVLAIGVTVLLVAEASAHRTPLSAGANVEAAWTYIHSPNAWRTHGRLYDVSRSGWLASARTIECDERYLMRWPKNRVLATNHVVYFFGTNGTLLRAKSHRKWVWPF